LPGFRGTQSIILMRHTIRFRLPVLSIDS
jgi:hypothetical protein